jgi:cytochrome bd ubiquinol oxidase subunit II
MMPFIWFVLILLCVLMYIALDGCDLGIGIATLLERDPGRRSAMIYLVSLVWDGNETWLVLLGVALWAGFPLAFGTILPHAFLPLTVFLFGLIVRGVSVVMVSQQPSSLGWQRAFGVGSLVAVLGLGVAASTLVSPLAVSGFAYNGSALGAMSWYSVLTALGLVAGCLALGYAYMKWKATSELRTIAGSRGGLAVVAAVVLGAACLGAINATSAPLNLAAPVRAGGFAWLIAVAVAAAVTAAATLRPSSRWDALPMISLTIAVVATFLAVVVARYPVLVPPGLTVGTASSPDDTYEFLAVGVGINIPAIIFYNWYAHYAFRGRYSRPAEAAADGCAPTTPASTRK